MLGKRPSLLIILLFFLIIHFLDWHFTSKLVFEDGVPNRDYIAVECNPVALYLVQFGNPRLILGLFKLIGISAITSFIFWFYKNKTLYIYLYLIIGGLPIFIAVL